MCTSGLASGGTIDGDNRTCLDLMGGGGLINTLTWQPIHVHSSIPQQRLFIIHILMLLSILCVVGLYNENKIVDFRDRIRVVMLYMICGHGVKAHPTITRC